MNRSFTRLEIRLFATLKERAGSGTIQITLQVPATVHEMLQVTAAEFPELAPALPSALVAVNKAYAGPDSAILEGDSIAVFPPVSGGASFAHPVYFAITEREVDINVIQAHLTQPDVGAIVTFTGSVRGETQREGLPPETLHLEYEAYQEMAEERMAQIAREIWQKWPQVKGVAIVQRVGKLKIGETTTVVACAAAHRDQGAFEAARYGIDRLKQIVPVWKKEIGLDHSEWVEGDYLPTEADN